MSLLTQIAGQNFYCKKERKKLEFEDRFLVLALK